MEGVGDKAEKARPFDRGSEAALVFWTKAAASPRGDFHLPGNKFAQKFCVFVVNDFLIFCAKIALFFHFCLRALASNYKNENPLTHNGITPALQDEHYA